MKILRSFCVVLALTVSLGVSVSSNAAEAEAVQTPVASNSMMDYFMSIRSDLTKAESTGEQMLGRIDNLVRQIDAEIVANPANKADLMKLRSSTLQMRARVVRFMSENGTQLVQLNGPIASLPVADGQVISERVIGEQMIELPGSSVGTPMPVGSTPLAGGSFGTPVTGGTPISGGSIGGGGVAGGGVAGGVGGSFGLIAAGASGIAVAASDDDNNNPTPGIVASPSN